MLIFNKLYFSIQEIQFPRLVETQIRPTLTPAADTTPCRCSSCIIIHIRTRGTTTSRLSARMHERT